MTVQGKVQDRSATLQPLLRAAEAFVPGMAGAIGEPPAGYITPGRDNGAILAALVDRVRVHYPEAGRGFWSLRSWNMLEWQPVVLTLIGVHELGLLPSLEGLGQRPGNAIVMGFRLPSQDPATGEPAALIPVGGRRLRALADRLLNDLNGVTAVKPLLARRLLADRVLGVLLRLGEQRPDLSPGQIEDYAARWLAALSLEDHSGLMALHREDGHRHLALDRRACCLVYRVHGQALCDSCPRLPVATRLQRLQEKRRHV